MNNRAAFIKEVIAAYSNDDLTAMAHMSQERNPPSSGSHTPFVSLAGDVVLWMVMVLILQVFRALMVWLFRADLSPETDATQLLRCFSVGLRFDIAVASCAILPSLALTVASFVRPLGAWHHRVRRVLVGTLLSVALLTFTINIGYFRPEFCTPSGVLTLSTT